MSLCYENLTFKTSLLTLDHALESQEFRALLQESAKVAQFRHASSGWLYP